MPCTQHQARFEGVFGAVFVFGQKKLHFAPNHSANMKSFLSQCLTLILLSVLMSGCSLFQGKSKTDPINITLVGGQITLNQKALPARNWTMSQLETAWGKADRVANLANNIYTYDKKGLIFYNTPGTEEVSAFNVYYNTASMPTNFDPKGAFKGKLSIEGKLVSAEWTAEDFQKALPQYKFASSYSSSTFRGESQGVYVYLQYTNDLSKLVYVNMGFVQ